MFIIGHPDVTAGDPMRNHERLGLTLGIIWFTLLFLDLILLLTVEGWYLSSGFMTLVLVIFMVVILRYIRREKEYWELTESTGVGPRYIPKE